MNRVYILTQVYPPDPAAVGQHLHEVAVSLVKNENKQVTVLTADAGYEDATQRFTRREIRDGVDIRRLPFSSLGKSSISVRLIGQFCFIAQLCLNVLFGSKPDRLLISTSPPLMGIVAWLARRIRGIPVTYWLMDLNPDQAVKLGIYREGHMFVRMFDWMNRRILLAAETTIVLDRFMAERVKCKLPKLELPLVTIPPWAPAGLNSQIIDSNDQASNPFRVKHGLVGKTVFMYSGNHSWVHPLTTVLEASRCFQEREDIVFVFVGGGKGKAEVKEFIAKYNPLNVIDLPYQPLETLPSSLSAADVHIVAMGDAMVGCVHPCKIYGVLAIGKPILGLAPGQSHIGEIVIENSLGEMVDNGDVDAAVVAVERLIKLSTREREDIREQAEKCMCDSFQREGLIAKVCKYL